MNDQLQAMRARNRLLTLVLWTMLVLGVIADALKHSTKTADLALTGGLVNIVLTFCVWRRLFIRHLQYAVVVGSSITFFQMAYASHTLSSYVFFLLPLPMVSLYNNYRSVLAGAAVELILIN